MMRETIMPMANSELVAEMVGSHTGHTEGFTDHIGVDVMENNEHAQEVETDDELGFVAYWRARSELNEPYLFEFRPAYSYVGGVQDYNDPVSL